MAVRAADAREMPAIGQEERLRAEGRQTADTGERKGERPTRQCGPPLFCYGQQLRVDREDVFGEQKIIRRYHKLLFRIQKSLDLWEIQMTIY